MYITKTTRYHTPDGQQAIARAPYLILVTPEQGKGEIRAIVRKVAMRQFGHFMMGVARVAGHSVVLSGSYGSDGLPTIVHRDVYDRAVPVPDDLIEKWGKGGGHNSAGNEAADMRAWARDNARILIPRRANPRNYLRVTDRLWWQ